MDATDRQLELGSRLRDIRVQQGLTLQDVERSSGGVWKAVVVGSYERGDRAITIARLLELAAFYGVPASEFLPTRPTGPSPGGRRARAVIDLTRLGIDGDGGTDGPLGRYVRTIQLQRGDYNGRVLTLRRADLQSLSIILGLGTDELVETLARRGLLVGQRPR